jgi:hypothetical protein
MVAAVDEGEELALEMADRFDRQIIDEAVGRREDDEDLLLDGSDSYCFCLSTSIRRAPRESWRWVAASRSDPNWANAASSRYCARSSFSVPATWRIALICAEPPTRLTEMPGCTAGRTPE